MTLSSRLDLCGGFLAVLLPWLILEVMFWVSHVVGVVA